MNTTQTAASQPNRIDLDDSNAILEWTRKFDVSAEQLREAVKAVGDREADIELHLKGTRSTSNADRVDAAPEA